jgi:hypothetical protein
MRSLLKAERMVLVCEVERWVERLGLSQVEAAVNLDAAVADLDEITTKFFGRPATRSEVLTAMNEANFKNHDCHENAVPYFSDGPLGHGWECGVCGTFLQAG